MYLNQMGSNTLRVGDKFVQIIQMKHIGSSLVKMTSANLAENKLLLAMTWMVMIPTSVTKNKFLVVHKFLSKMKTNLFKKVFYQMQFWNYITQTNKTDRKHNV